MLKKFIPFLMSNSGKLIFAFQNSYLTDNFVMFYKIRTLVGNYFLKEELSKTGRERTITNLRDARKIGILYTLDDVPEYETVSEFVSRLQHDHKEVKALGFVKNKNLVSRFLPKLSYDFFSRKDINWFFKPLHSRVKDFIEKEFDILIDLSMKDSLPLKFISGLSLAHCRIGRFSEGNRVCYDIMIDLTSPLTLNEYILQIVHYLTVINNNERTIH
jgi:hypothetical protein